MTNLNRDRIDRASSAGQVSLLALGSGVIRWRRQILALAGVGAVIGLLSGLLAPRVYVAGATFLPQASEGPSSGLAAAASQLGIAVPSSGGTWGPPLYVRVLNSSALLELVLVDTLTVTEEGGRRTTLLDLLDIQAPTPALRIERGIRVLRLMMSAQEIKALNAVELSVRTRWPSVSYALAQRLVAGVNEFNVRRRKSQAGAERQFADSMAGEAERTLRAAEDRLQAFSQRNRVFVGSPELTFERDRLQREVGLRQQLYTSLLQSREDARIREVRGTPVITLLEAPRMPVVPESRKAALKTILGALVGVTLGILAAFLAHAVGRARQSPDEDAEEFLRLVAEATPGFLKRRRG